MAKFDRPWQPFGVLRELTLGEKDNQSSFCQPFTFLKITPHKSPQSCLIKQESNRRKTASLLYPSNFLCYLGCRILYLEARIEIANDLLVLNDLSLDWTGIGALIDPRKAQRLFL